VIEVLDDAVAAIDGQPPGDALVEAGVRKVLGTAYAAVAEYEKAAPQLRRAYALRQTLPEDDIRRVASAVDLATLLTETGPLQEAQALLEAQLAVLRGLLDRAGETPELLQSLGSILNGLGECHVRQGRPDEAEPYYLEALEAARRASPERRVDLATITSNLSQVYGARGEHARVIEMLEQALAIRREILPQDHPSLAYSLHNIGQLLAETGRTEAAERRLLAAERIRRTVLTPEDPRLAATLNSLGVLYLRGRDFERAAPYLEESLAIRRKKLPARHYDLAESINSVSALYVATERWDEAKTLAREAVSIFAETRGAQSAAVGVASYKLAEIQFLCGDAEAAEPIYRRTAEVFRALENPAIRPFLAQALFGWARCLARLERWDEVEAPARESVSLLEQGPADAVLLAEARGLLGEWLTLAARYEEAQPLLLASLETLSKAENVSADRLSQARSRLVTLYEGWGRPDEADRYR
jgi:tetratricopeptide (TPR) repeat protein